MDTAVALRSGDVPALATPRLLAWAEAATVGAITGRLGPRATTVGVRVELNHRAPTAVGMDAPWIRRTVGAAASDMTVCSLGSGSAGNRSSPPSGG